ncbi:unnamed protein product [Bursaphelenchus xylophilus]|uniref:(pine wood nematode) hypothetical protein n=1 Tax=Bursaphelenchus xylophilus TaxID=6326 RepID=A0A1I7SD94_BURXY|nr:unnamed protein product [Bursaphelenchus xylophilus]CAG9130548.1 unnamed protein product [Bursaphelenchus xylophilus]
MNLKFLQTLIEPENSISRIPSIAYSPNDRKLAIATNDRVIHLFDDKGNRKDKINTKPIESQYGKQSYKIQSVCFSPDSTKLAVAQTDTIVFVYRLGESWDEKKVICNKFVQSSAANVLAWPEESKLIVGLANGRIRNASVGSNKCSTLYKTDVFTISLSVHPNKKSFVSGHLDGSIILFSFESKVQTKIVVHSTAPYCLLRSNFGILAAGSDRRIVSYSDQGRMIQQYDYNKDNDEKEFTTAVIDPSGLNAVFGSFNKLRLMSWNPKRGAWDEGSVLVVQNMYSVSALAWRPDGSSVICGTMMGGAISVDCCLRRALLKNRFVTTYVSPSQVVVKDVESERQCSLRSLKGLNINDIRVVGRANRHVVAYTPSTLVLADMETGLFSEVTWNSGGNEKFYVDNENVCMIVNAGEISIVEYGKHDIIGWIRTERISPHLISVRIGESSRKTKTQHRRVAYMLDIHTINIMNLDNSQIVSQINHGSTVDWLELNDSGEKLLFRDIRSTLLLHDIETEQTFTMANFCSYVQWVPESDVVVAQCTDQLCVWYNTDNVEQIVQIPILGDVDDVLRDKERTEVIVIENNAKVAYELDNTLIEFATAIDNRDLNRALEYLESSERDRTDISSMWRQMASVALEEGNLLIAQRCYAGLNDISRVRFIEDTMDMMADNKDSYKVKARMALLRRDLKESENIYLSNNATEEALEMYQKLHRWSASLDLARATNYPDQEGLKMKYQRYLHETGQSERAAELKAEEGKLVEAVDLFLQSNRPVMAASLLSEHRTLAEDDILCNKVAESLHKNKVYARAGEVYELNGQYEKALEDYEMAQAFNKAINIARTRFPDKVTELEEKWGDSLCNNGDYTSAISHYLESGANEKAADAAIKGKEWDKAIEVVEALDKENNKQYYEKLARHFEANGQFDKAERFYLDADMMREAVEMYNKAGRWSDAYKLALEMLGQEQTQELYFEKAQELEEQGQYNTAEELYVTVGEPNNAIAMYKRLNRLEDMMRLVERFHSEHVDETHIRLAQDLAKHGELKSAEEQYLLADDWKSVVAMYKDEGKWADAYRVAQSHGGDLAHKQVSYLWAKSLGGEAAIKLLQRHGALEDAIDIGVNKGDFDFVFELCRLGCQHRLQEVQVKHAEHLEDEGDLRRAETFYLQAGKIREAVLMYIHSQEWIEAERLARQYAPEMADEVYINHARAALEEKDTANAESYLLRANRADIILKYYREMEMWPDAIRIAKEYVPEYLTEVENEYENVQLRAGERGAQSFLVRAKDFELDGEYEKAVENYLKVDTTLTNDTNLITQALRKAGELVSKFFGSDQKIEIGSRVGNRLTELNENLAASEVYLAVNMNKEAIHSLMMANEWSKAQKIAEELQPDMIPEVDQGYKDYLKNQGRVGELVDVDVLSAINVYVSQSNWEKALSTAAQQNHPALLEKYVAMYVSELIQAEKFNDAVKLFEQYGTPLNTFNTYKMLLDVMINQKNISYEDLSHLRNMILKLNVNMINHKTEVNERVREVFNRYLYVLHYYCLCLALQDTENPDIEKLVVRLKISMLRYVDLVQPDKLFYEAGIACSKVQGYENMAFTFLNQFVDIHNAVETNDPSEVNNDIFEGTDIPVHYTLPQEAYLGEDEYEKINEMVLEMSADRKTEKKLKTDSRGCYEASSVDLEGRVYPTCLLSGYPILDTPKILSEEMFVDPKTWHQFITLIRTNPSDNLFDIQSFLSMWTGTTVSITY